MTTSRIERFAPLVAGLAFAVPTLVARYLPMTDLALHEGAVAMLRHHGDPQYAPPGLYLLNIGHPNQLFHLVAWALSYAVGTDWAVKLVVAAAQVLVFVGAGHLADHFGRSRWSALLVAPLALGFTYYWGLVANLVGYAVFLLVLPALDRAMEAPSARRAAGSFGWLVLLYFAHESMFIQVIAVLGLFLVLQPRSSWTLRGLALRVAPMAGGALLFAGQQVWQAKLFPRSQPVPPATFFSLWEKILYFPNALFGSHDLPMLLLLVGLAAVALVGFAIGRVQQARGGGAGAGAGGGRFGRLRAAAHRNRFELAAFCLLVAYFTMPFNYLGTTLLHERFLGPAWALGVIGLAPRGVPARMSRLAAAVLPVGVLLVSWPQFYDADRTYRTLDPILERIPYGSATAYVILTPAGFSTGRVYSAGPAPSRALAVRGGRVLEALTMSPISPVLMREDARWDDIDARTVWNGSYALRPGLDLQRYGWLIAGSRDPYLRDVVKEALDPDAELVAESGEWQLYKSRHPAVPIDSPPLPEDARYDMIVHRVNAIRARNAEAYKRSLKKAAAPPPPAPAPEGSALAADAGAP